MKVYSIVEERDGVSVSMKLFSTADKAREYIKARASEVMDENNRDLMTSRWETDTIYCVYWMDGAFENVHGDMPEVVFYMNEMEVY